MWGSKKSGFSVSGSTTLISRDTVVIGDLHFSGTLDIEGLVQGNVEAQPDTEAVVRIVNKGRVEGQVRAPSVIVNGVVEGDIHSSRTLELAAKGRVQGNVYYSRLEMAAGSEVNGSLTHLVESETAKEKKPAPAVEVVEAGEQQRRDSVAPAKVD